MPQQSRSPRTQDLLQREVSVYEVLEQIGWSASMLPEPGGISEMCNLLLQFASQTEQWRKGNTFLEVPKGPEEPQN